MSAQSAQSAAGRGRGRGRGVTNAPPAKPGGGGSRDPMEQLQSMIKSLSFDSDDKEILPVKATAAKAGTSPEKLEEIARSLYQRCQEDWRFAKCGAKICLELETVGLEVDGTKFRKTYLLIVQEDFKNKDKSREESPQKFLGNVSFMCQIYGQLRDSEGNPFKPMTLSVMEALEMLLDDKASDEEMMCAAELLYATGKILSKFVDKIRMTALRNKVKDKIIHAVGGREARKELLIVVEAFASDWKNYT